MRRHILKPMLGVLLLTTLALAGCADPAAPEEPEPTVAPGPEISMLENVAMPQNRGSAEPNIAALPDGTLFVTAPVGLQGKPNAASGAAYLWRSTDGGESWEILRAPDLEEQGVVQPLIGACSCDADVVTSSDGWVYYTDWWSGIFAGNYVVEASSDGGETWRSWPTPVPQHTTASMDRQWLVAGEDGFVGLFYSFFGEAPFVNTEGRRIVATFSSDYGQTWSQPVTVVPHDPEEAYQIAHPFWHGEALVMPYGAVDLGNTFWSDPSEVRVAISYDLGATWDHTVVADVPEGFGNLWAVQGASDGTTAGVVWADNQDNGMAIHFATSANLTDWHAERVTAEGLHMLPWAAAKNGTFALGWYGTQDAEGRTDPREVPDDTPWYAYVALQQGGPWSIEKVSDAPVKEGPLCPRGASCNGDRELLDYVSLLFAPDGTLHYAFARSDEGGGSNLDGAHIHVTRSAAPVL